MTDFAARLLYVFAASVARLPWRWLMSIGDGIALLWRKADVRESRVCRRNLELAFPQMPASERERLHADILRVTARQALETLRLWTRPHARNLALIRDSHGIDLFDAAIDAGKGLIVAAPHYGNWELLNQWLAAKTPISILYRPPKVAVAEAFLRLVRADSAARVAQIRAEGAAVRQLWKLMKQGGVAGILPDQQPKAGDGEFAPFFGKQALTMTLLNRLAERSGAAVLFAYCERLGEGPEFALRIEAAPPGIDSPDPATGVYALNAAVENIAQRDLAQYQWTYKRYTLRPPDSGEDNPYRDLETH